MTSNARVFLTGALLILGACAVPSKPPAPPMPLPPATKPVPVLEKTFGTFQMDSAGTLFIQYKSIQVLVDPAPGGSVDTAKIDYLLLTQAPARPLTARKDLKIMAPEAAAAALTSQGYTQVKSVSTSQRIYLKKEDTFLFVSAATSGDKAANSYLLEFENGRNIFVSGPLKELDALREMVFSLRDDGREVHAAVISAPSDQQAAEAIALLQPQFAFYDAGGRSPDQKQLNDILKNDMYEGVFSLLKRGQSIPF